MAERLTKEYYYTWDENGTKKLSYIQKLQNKLGKLEDILEKYGLEVEELDERIYNGAFNYIDKLKAETDRDTWKRACELMGKELDMYATKEDNTISTAQYFYQQAKKEGNDDK